MVRLLIFGIKAGLALAVGLGVLALVKGAEAEEFSTDHLKVARQAAIATGALSAFDDMLPMLAEDAKALFMRADPGDTIRIEKTVSEVAFELAEERVKLNQAIDKIWAEAFSDDELKRIVFFYTSETGKKLANLGPALTEKGLQAAGSWGDAVSVDIVERVQKRLESSKAQ